MRIAELDKALMESVDTFVADVVNARELIGAAIRRPTGRDEYFKFIRHLENKHGSKYSTDVHKQAISMSKLDLTEEIGENPTDTINCDVPLMIRLMEYAREDAKSDMELHKVAEKLTELSKTNTVLTMDDYNQIIGK